jgi:Flp pilus assembly pilin Flp
MAIPDRVLLALLTLACRDEGQGLAEYAMILLLVALAVVAALGVLGGQIANRINAVAGAF